MAQGVVWIPLEQNPLRDKENVAVTQVNYLIDDREQ